MKHKEMRWRGGLDTKSAFFSQWEKNWPVYGFDCGKHRNGVTVAHARITVLDEEVRIGYCITRDGREIVDRVFEAKLVRSGVLLLVEFHDHAELSERLQGIENGAEVYFEVFEAMEKLEEMDRAPGFEALPALWALESIGAPDEYW